ncbi:endonuclease-3 [Halorubrum aquaticum]|uniref:Endonuclease-3 n=1 Tax=Halorubrum aquaticum TaxID=387340 RepID=A0A1I2Z567_9EURY|nr:GIY-YIG nuclease family protein [Halorubrum aquaticum]SFH33007.1 endonuclease-3 [Halorubrum aquaticum]
MTEPNAVASSRTEPERTEPDRDLPADAPGGTYTLLVDLPSATTPSVGALGARRFPAGGYAYTGSALGSGGFSRVRRHRRTARGDHDVRHWHVDYLLGETDARIDRVVHAPGVDAECAVAARLPEGPVDGFGASDCECPSHLAAAASLDDLAGQVIRAYDAEGASIRIADVDG